METKFERKKHHECIDSKNLDWARGVSHEDFVIMLLRAVLSGLLLTYITVVRSLVYKLSRCTNI